MFANSDCYGNDPQISCCIPLQRWLLLLGAVLHIREQTRTAAFILFTQQKGCAWPFLRGEPSPAVVGRKGSHFQRRTVPPLPPALPCSTTHGLGAGGGMCNLSGEQILLQAGAFCRLDSNQMCVPLQHPVTCCIPRVPPSYCIGWRENPVCFGEEGWESRKAEVWVPLHPLLQLSKQKSLVIAAPKSLFLAQKTGFFLWRDMCLECPSQQEKEIGFASWCAE